jgi:hypothetical protein
MTNTRKTPEATAPRNVPLRTAIKAGADDAKTDNAGKGDARNPWRFRHTFGEPSNEG